MEELGLQPVDEELYKNGAVNELYRDVTRKSAGHLFGLTRISKLWNNMVLDALFVDELNELETLKRRVILRGIVPRTERLMADGIKI